ncbi:MAG: hypothetical protein NXH86_01060 [Flavobacteriaceae bacterium]|uniref:hypothetical protein n=1 Tax=Flagellimonas sp. SN16 TaxID=3415142 RepID=UPI003C468CC7|nr:hypothetical protein [Flavobacteriaceae bacterium]
MNYTKKFEDLLNQLKDNPYIKVDTEFLSLSLDDEDIEDLKDYYKIREMPESVLAFYRQMDGVEIEWHYEPNNGQNFLKKQHNYDDLDYIKGVINIPNLGSLLNYDKFLDNWADTIIEEEKEDLFNFRHIDDNDNNDWIRVGFIIENGAITDKLYYLKSGSDGFCSLECTFAEYIDALIQAKGFVGWQQTFTIRKEELLRNNSSLFFYIPQLFPGEKLDNFM